MYRGFFSLRTLINENNEMRAFSINRNGGMQAFQTFFGINLRYNNNNNLSANEINSMFQALTRALEQAVPNMGQNQRNNPHLT